MFVQFSNFVLEVCISATKYSTALVDSNLLSNKQNLARKIFTHFLRNRGFVFGDFLSLHPVCCIFANIIDSYGCSCIDFQGHSRPLVTTDYIYSLSFCCPWSYPR